MPNTTTGSPSPAPTKRKSRKSQLDTPMTFVTGFEATKPPIVSNGRGVWLHLAAADGAILDERLAKAAELPSPLFRSKRQVREDLRLTRRLDGRCNVVTFGIESAKLDASFQDFMKGLMADRQLSLVANEKGRSE